MFGPDSLLWVFNILYNNICMILVKQLGSGHGFLLSARNILRGLLARNTIFTKSSTLKITKDSLSSTLNSAFPFLSYWGLFLVIMSFSLVLRITEVTKTSIEYINYIFLLGRSWIAFMFHLVLKHSRFQLVLLSFPVCISFD